MDKAFLSGIFRDVVLRDGELILPFMGCIKLEDVPASFSEGGLVVAPPSKKLYFDNYSLSSNDNLLNEYAARLEVSRMAAKRALYKDVEEIRNGAEADGRYTLEGFGTFCFDKDQGYTIETDPEFMLSRDTFGLSAVDLRDDSVKAEEKAAEERRLAEERKVAEEKRLAEEKAAQERKIAEEKAAEEKRIAEEKRLAQEKAAEERKVAEEKAAEEKLKAEAEKQAGEKSTAGEKKTSRSYRWLYILLTVLAILLILVLLVFVFKEELRPVLEKILYSKQELEIINYKL
jgi:cobalamin biosynthesis Mg chelatase CobN